MTKQRVVSTLEDGAEGTEVNEVGFTSYIKDVRGEPLNVVSIYKGKDGKVSFFSQASDGFVYLYPSQVEHLKKILDMRLPRQKKSE